MAGSEDHVLALGKRIDQVVRSVSAHRGLSVRHACLSWRR